MACKEFECLICGKCKEESKIDNSKYTAEPEIQKSKEPRIRTDTQMADATIVYVLGYLEDDSTLKQVDEYSGLNGYHIRTIPGRRWNTPIMVGAGAGYLAVVDRFQDYDLIRVTDKYGGAGTAGFDSDGFPKDSVDWASLADICSQATPAGSRVVGLKITPQGMLIAHLSSTGTFLKFDVAGRAAGKVSRVMEGTKTLEPPFDSLGSMIGTPATVTAKAGSQMFYSVGLISSGDKVIVAVIDTLKHRVVGLQGLPAQPTPISATISNNVVSVLCGNDGIGTQVIRFVVDLKGGGLLAGIRSGKETPKPQNYTVEQFPKLKDFRGRNFTPADLNTYYKIATDLNDPTDDRVVPDFSEADLPTLDGATSTSLDGRVSSEGHIVSEYYSKAISVPMHVIPCSPTLGLKTIEGTHGNVTELFNQKNDAGTMDREKPIFRVLHGGHYDIVGEGGYTYGSAAKGYTNGMVGESVATDKDYELGKLKIIDAKAALVDSTTGLLVYRHPKPGIEPIGWRVYGGDYASLDPTHTGGALELEIQAIQDDINRLQGAMEQQIAEHPLLDTSAFEAEIAADSAWQSKLEARLTALGTSGISVKRTQASTDIETALKALDGVERRVVTSFLSPWLYPYRLTQPNGEPVSAFSANAECADDYWTMFLRRPTVANRFDVRLIRKSWSREYDDGSETHSILPEWLGHNLNPIESTGTFDLKVTPKSADTLTAFPPSINHVGRGGFYALSVPFGQMSNLERYSEEISSLGQLSEDYQRIINAENAKAAPDTSVVERYTQYIGENDDRIAELHGWIDTKSAANYAMASRQAIGVTFRNLDRSIGQAVPDTSIVGESQPYTPPEVMVPVSPDVAYANRWKTIAVGEAASQRGCVIDTGPKAWVAVTIGLKADDLAGEAIWQYPETRRNGLGIKIGTYDVSGDYATAFNIVSGSVYSSGWRTFASDDAYATWGYRVKGVPRTGQLPASVLSTYDPLKPGGVLIPTDMAAIRSLAPLDAQALLVEDGSTKIGDTSSPIFKIPLYYYAELPLAQVIVEFWLTHTALDVYRYGYRTLSFGGDNGETPICPQVDPAYWGGNNCEAAACGNVSCASALLGSEHKLYSSDPTYPRVDTAIVSGGIAIFTCANDPYADLGLAYGTVWKCNVDFDLNNAVRAFEIPIKPDGAPT